MICHVAEAFPDHISARLLFVTDSVCLTGFTWAKLSPDSSISGSIAEARSSSSVSFSPPVGRALNICASILKRPESPDVPTPSRFVNA